MPVNRELGQIFSCGGILTFAIFIVAVTVTIITFAVVCTIVSFLSPPPSSPPPSPSPSLPSSRHCHHLRDIVSCLFLSGAVVSSVNIVVPVIIAFTATASSSPSASPPPSPSLSPLPSSSRPEHLLHARHHLYASPRLFLRRWGHEGAFSSPLPSGETEARDGSATCHGVWRGSTRAEMQTRPPSPKAPS